MEVTLVIALLLTLAGIVTYSVSSMTEWKTGRESSEKLRSVLLAQKSFLADNPSKSIATFTSAELIPYLPGRPGAMPTAKTKDNQTLALNFLVMPPVFTLSGTAYDPSGSTTDGIWDVGNL